MIVLKLPFPPSVNSYWRHISKGPLAGRTLLSEKGRAYRSDVAMTLLQRPERPRALQARLSVSIDCHAPDRRARDLDNLPKGILDALTHAEVWLDDSQIDELTIRRKEPQANGCVIVTIHPIEGAEPELFPAGDHA